MTNQYHDQELQRCIAECTDCHRVCLAALGTAGLEPGIVGLLLDCAQMCQVATDSMVRVSPLHGYVCGLCAHVCKVCGDRCGRLGASAGLASCAARCHACADSCLRLSKAAAYESMLV